MIDCDCNKEAHRTATILGHPGLQCDRCGRITLCKDIPRIETETARNWRKAMRNQRAMQFCVVMVGLYGLALYLMGGLCLALAVVPSHPSIGVASIVALSVAFLAAGNQWRAWWRRVVG